VFEQAGAGKHGNAGGAGEFPGAVLQAEVDHLLRRGPDEGEARVFAGFGEGGVFAEEAVAGVDGFGAGLLGGGENGVNVKIAAWATDGDGFVGLAHEERFGVDFRVDGDALHAHLAQGANDAAGNGAAVGDEDFLKHYSVTTSLIGVGL